MPEIPTQPQPASEKKSINWKNIIIGIVVGAILVGLGVLIFLILQPKPTETTQTPTKKATPSANISTPSAKKDETASWKVVENDVLGYSIKYPKGWSVLRCKNSASDNYNDSETQFSHPEYSKVLAGADVCASGARTRIIIYRGEVFTDNVAIWGKFGAKYTNYIQEEITVDGEKGIKSSYISKQSPGMNAGNEFIEYIFNGTSDEALIINYYRAPPDDLNPPQPDYSDILEKMVATLKFLD